MQILKAIHDPNYGWQHHPAVTMWRGYEAKLVYYGLQVCWEWKSRGFKDTCEAKILSFGSTFGEKPPWLTEEFASNHRAILLGKVREKLLSFEDGIAWTDKTVRQYEKSLDQLKWYEQFNWSENPAKRNEDGRWGYLWPEVTK